jgi:hypothetical protein
MVNVPATVRVPVALHPLSDLRRNRIEDGLDRQGVSRPYADESLTASAADSPQKQSCTSGRMCLRRRRCRRGCLAMAGQYGFRRSSPCPRRVGSRPLFASACATLLARRRSRSNGPFFESGRLLAWCHRSASPGGSMVGSAWRRVDSGPSTGDRFDNSPTNQK